MPTAQELVDSDWPSPNLASLRGAVQNAYAAVAQTCDPATNPLFDSPNRSYGVGYCRWLAMDKYIHDACLAGQFVGITPEWIPFTTNMGITGRSLVLHGKHTSLSIVHLSEPNENPRESLYRKSQRVENDQSPLLPGFSDPDIVVTDDKEDIIHLSLVHGNKNAEFAELRAYYTDSYGKRKHSSFSGNIMKTSHSSSAPDVEVVPEIEISLIPKSDPKVAGEA